MGRRHGRPSGPGQKLGRWRWARRQDHEHVCGSYARGELGSRGACLMYFSLTLGLVLKHIFTNFPDRNDAYNHIMVMLQSLGIVLPHPQPGADDDDDAES